VGGGISTIEDVSALINAGADKVAINSSAIKSPELIEKIASQFGSQCLVLAIDTKEIKSQWKVFSHGGRIETDLELFSWAEKAIELGAGELLITSMSGDGTKKGFDVHLMSKLALKFKVPIIASGGAGEIAHFEQLFTQSNVTGALAASVFHFNEISIPALKKSLKNKQIEVR
jgi:cyclase